LDRSQRTRDFDLLNLSVSKCYSCSELTIWIDNQVLWPKSGEAAPPNVDLPNDIKDDYLEASSILNLSPRGSAALLRLAVQKLCRFLGEHGKDINQNIASLVAKGLDQRIQQALDVVRVVGNHAVHPGTIDLKDDRATAARLFELVNLISERMISQPRHVEEMFSNLPPEARAAIAKRDEKK
jgi:hypothetical protein